MGTVYQEKIEMSGRSMAVLLPSNFLSEGEMASNDREGAGRKVGFEIGPIVPRETPDALLQASGKVLHK